MEICSERSCKKQDLAFPVSTSSELNDKIFFGTPSSPAAYSVVLPAWTIYKKLVGFPRDEAKSSEGSGPVHIARLCSEDTYISTSPACFDADNFSLAHRVKERIITRSADLGPFF